MDTAKVDFPRRSPVAIAVPIVVVALTFVMVGWTAWPTIRPVRTVVVTQAVLDRSTTTDIVSTTPAGVAVQAPGWLEAEPYHVACTALADGVLESLDVLEGDSVEEGQIVARLIAEDAELGLAVAEANLASTRATLTLAEAEQTAALAAWDEPVELQRAVETGVARLAESQAELAQLPALIEAAVALRVRLEEEIPRQEASLAKQAISELEVIKTRQDLLAQRAQVDVLEARRPLLEARVERLEAELRASRRNLELRIEERRRVDAAGALVARAQSEVLHAAATRDEAALELERMTIRSPISGYVQRRLKVPGDKVFLRMDSPHSAHILHVYDPMRLQVRVDVPLADAANISIGQACEVVVEVLPDRTFQGEVTIITHEADLQKNTLQAKVRVVDPSPLLRPEMLTRVKFLPAGGNRPNNSTADGAARVLVPAGVLLRNNGSAVLWVVRDRRADRGVARSINVQVVSENDGWVVVTGTINPGELIVESADGLSDGTPVRFTSGGAA